MFCFLKMSSLSAHSLFFVIAQLTWPLSHRMNVQSDKAVWRMWLGWILMLAHSYCKKKKNCLPGNPSKWLSPCHRNVTSPFVGPLPLRCIFKSLATAYENILWHRLFLLCCTRHVKCHEVIWASWNHMAKSHCIIINTPEHKHNLITCHLTWDYWRCEGGQRKLIDTEFLETKVPKKRLKVLIYLPSSSGPHMAPCSHHSRLSLFPWWSECHQPAQHQKGPHNLQG